MTQTSATPRDPAALLIIRVWIERGSERPLRAYIRESRNVARGFDRSTTVTDVDSALEVVRTWMEDSMDASASDTTIDVVAGDS